MSAIDKETFTYWITHPQDLSTSDISRLEATAKAFPYCQITYYLLAKASSQTKPFKFSEAIPKAAIYALSRKALRELIEEDSILPGITGNDFQQKSPSATDDYDRQGLAKQLSMLEMENTFLLKPALTSSEEPEERQIFDDQMLKEQTIREEIIQKEKVPEEEPKKDDRISYTASEPEKQLQQNIIEKFIQNDPRIGSIRLVSKDLNESMDLTDRLQASTSMDNFATESFAKLFIRQGKIDKAIGVYEKLILKNPEKKDYFAEKINELRGKS
jgi:hypothetical protein